MNFKVLGYICFLSDNKLYEINLSKNMLYTKYQIFEIRGFMRGFMFSILAWPVLFHIYIYIYIYIYILFPFYNRSINFT